MYQSIRNGRIEELSSVSTIADGIAVKRPGDLTFALIRQYVDEIATVTDDEISCAILTLMEKQKMIAEGAGAVSVAAAMFDKFPIAGKKVVSIVSGGNIDVTSLSRVVTRGLEKSGRTTSIQLELIDKPGQLKNISRIIADCGANLTAIYQERDGSVSNVNGCFLRLTMETRNFDHIHQIRQALQDAGYVLVN